MTIRSFLPRIALTAIFLAQLRLAPSNAQTQLSGNQIRITSSMHTGNAYTVTPRDCGTLLSFSAAASTVALPQAGASGLHSGCWMDMQNIGPGAVTVTPATSTIDGLTSLQLNAGQGLHLVSNGTNFVTVRGGGGGGTWTNVTTPAAQTPVFAAVGMPGITFRYTLTFDVASSSFTGPAAGLYIFSITQDSSGGHAFAWPLNVTNAPVVDRGANNTTYMQCQFDGTSCVGIGSDVIGPAIAPGLTIPGLTSGSNTVTTPAVAGTGSTTNLAPNGTTVVPNACAGQVVQSIGADGTIACGAGAGSGGGSVGTAGLTIPGVTSGSNTITPPAVAGTGSTTNLAPNGTTVIPNTCAGQVVQAIASDGTITCASAGGAPGAAGISIPGQTSGSNTLRPPATAGTGSTTNLAPNGTTVIPNACAGQVVQSIAADGSITCGAGGGGSGGLVTRELWAPFGGCLLGGFAAGSGYAGSFQSANHLSVGCSGNAFAGAALSGYLGLPPGAADSEFIYEWKLPAGTDLAGGIAVTLKVAPGNSAGGNAVFGLQTACMDGHDLFAAATPFNAAVKTTVTMGSVVYILQSFTQTISQGNGLLNGCAAGNLIFIKFNRIGNDAGDTFPSSTYLAGGAELRWKEAQ